MSNNKSQDDWNERHAQQRAEELDRVTDPRAEAIAGAKWWGDQLRAGIQTSAGDAQIDVMMSWARSMSGDRHACSEEMIAKFESVLARRIEAEIIRRAADDLDGKPSWVWYVTLSVDYGPDMDLGEAARASGISDSNPSLVFPIKTNMWIDRGRIKVSAGYRAQEQTVWVSDEGAMHWATQALTKCTEELNAISEGLDPAISSDNQTETAWCYLPLDCPRCGRQRLEAEIVVRGSVSFVRRIICEKKCGWDSNEQ